MRTTALLLVFSAMLCVSRNATAQDDAARRAQAEARFREGVALHEQGNEREARLRFEEAHAVLANNANLLFNLARTEELTGDEPLAARHYRECLWMSGLFEKPRSLATKFLSDLDHKLAQLKIIVPEGANVLVDGVATAGSLTDSVYVRPGPHSVVARLGSAQQGVDRALTLAGNVTTVRLLQDVHVVASVDTPTTSSIVQPAPSPGPEPTSGGVAVAVLPATEQHRDGAGTERPNREPTAKVVTSVSLGVVGLALGVAGALDLKAAGDRASDVQTLAAQNPYCATPTPSPGCASLSNAAHANAADQNVGVGLMLSGGALLAGGIATWLLWPKETGREHAWVPTPVVTMGSASLQWSAVF